MLIRSQNKEILLDTETGIAYRTVKSFLGEGFMVATKEWNFGTYGSLEEAIDVLSQIESLMKYEYNEKHKVSGQYGSFRMPDQDKEGNDEL